MTQLLADIQAGAFDVVDLTPTDYERVATLLTTYAGLDVGFVDAA